MSSQTVPILMIWNDIDKFPRHGKGYGELPGEIISMDGPLDIYMYLTFTPLSATYISL